MNNKKLFASAANVLMLCALTSQLQAASITSATIDWSSFAITADGVDITSAVSWSDQFDFITGSYSEGSGSTIETFHDIDPNSGFSTSQTTHDGGIATSADTSVNVSSLTASSVAHYTGRADADISRTGIFTASAARYTFSFDYSLLAEINTTNSEATGGSSNPLVSSPYVQLDVYNNTTGQFVFLFDDSVNVNGFGTASNSGTLTATQDFDNILLDFSAGDEIELYINASTTSRSFSTQAIQPPSAPMAAPLPATAWLFISGLLGLLGIARRRA